jgi:hypothetical protein
MAVTSMEKISIAPGAIFFYGSQLDFLPRGEDSFLPNHLHMMPSFFSPPARVSHKPTLPQIVGSTIDVASGASCGYSARSRAVECRWRQQPIQMDSSFHGLLRDDELQDSFERANCSNDDEMSEEDSPMSSKNLLHAARNLAAIEKYGTVLP